MEHEGDVSFNKPAPPFDDFSAEVSEFATDLLEDLCAGRARGDPDRWSGNADHDLQSWWVFEDALRMMPLPSDLHLENQQLTFHKHIDHFHAALPFSEEERVWLLKLDDFLEPKSTCRTSAEWYSKQEQVIIVAGIRQVVRGRDLMHRWHAWRRQIDAYSEQDTLRVARASLWGLIQLLKPDTPKPEVYKQAIWEETRPPISEE